jgi:hypothetical protein
VNWFHLAQEWVKWRKVVNEAKDLQLPLKRWDLKINQMTSQETLCYMSLQIVQLKLDFVPKAEEFHKNNINPVTYTTSHETRFNTKYCFTRL